jgi:hypothetical protein
MRLPTAEPKTSSAATVNSCVTAGDWSRGSAFTTLGYTPVRGLAPGRRFRRMLTTRFDEVVASRTVIRNLSPAFVYYARRPA